MYIVCVDVNVFWLSLAANGVLNGRTSVAQSEFGSFWRGLKPGSAAWLERPRRRSDVANHPGAWPKPLQNLGLKLGNFRKKCNFMIFHVENEETPHFWLFSGYPSTAPLRDVDSCWADGSAKHSPGTSVGSPAPPETVPCPAPCREATDRRRPGVSKAWAS